MRLRGLLPFGVLTVATLVFLWAPVRLAAQDREAVREAAREAAPHTKDSAGAYWEKEVADKIAAATKRVYDPNKPLPANPPRKPWGDPDISGYFVSQTYTPLERPKSVDKPLYTVEEAIVAFKKTVEADSGVDPADVHYDWKEFGMDAWQSPIMPNLRTGLIVDPPTGRRPALTAAAEKRRADAAARNKVLDPQTSVSTFPSTYTRCAMGNGQIPLINGGNPEGAGGLGSAGGVTAEKQIFQAPGYVIIQNQSNNDIRIVPIEGRPLPEHLRFWEGVSRGRWEGNTLVIETANFRDRGPSNFIEGATDALKVVERISYLDENTWRYQYTVTDPNTWTAPWTVEAPMPRIDPPLYEFACHEQNYGLINLVMGAQITATKSGQIQGGR
jgi:hypothetical protein